MYRWDPEDYHKHSSAQECIAEGIISKLKIRGNEHILDIGCGDGKVTSKLASLVPQGQVLGIDSSKEMIYFSQKKFSSSNYANLKFEYLDVLNLKYESIFDIVTSFACLHWVKDHPSVLKNVKLSLKPRGRLLFQCAGKRTNYDLAVSGKDVIKSDHWKNYYRGFSSPYANYGPEDYHAWLALADLEELNVEMTIEEMVLPGRDGLEGFIRTTWLPIIEQVPEELRQRLVWEITERYLEKHPLRDGFARVNMPVLLVEARKPE